MSTVEAQVWKVSRPGGPEVMEWETRQLPEPGPGEVRLRQTFAGVNFVDVYHRSGLYPVEWPTVLGQEGVGVVEAVGPGVRALRPGDRVGYVGLLGGYSTARLAPADRLIKLPDTLADADAAALLFKGMTAEMLVRRAYRVDRGEVLLVEAAAGGVGQLLTRWATALRATVIGVVGSEAKVQLAREAGCAEVIVSSKEDVVARTLELTGGRGVDVVYESTGGEGFLRVFDLLRPRGTVVSFGQASGEIPRLPLDVLGRRSHFLTRPSIRNYLATADDLALSASALFEQIRRGVLSAHVGQRFPLADAPEAHRALEGRRTVGSTVLEVK